MFVEFAVVLLIFPNMLIYPFWTHLNALVIQDPMRRLLGAKVHFQVPINKHPLALRYPFLGLVAPLLRHPLCLFVPIASLSCVAPQLTTNSRSMNTSNSRNLCLIKSCFQKVINKVFLFLGKLCNS